MSDKPSYTYYPTVIYDMTDIRKSFVETLMVQLMSAEQESAVELAPVEGYVDLEAFVAARPGPRAPSAATLDKFDSQLSAIEELFSNNTIILRELFEDGHTLMLLGRAIAKDEYGLECTDVVDSLKNNLVDEIIIRDHGKTLIILQEGEWTIGESDNYLEILERLK